MSTNVIAVPTKKVALKMMKLNNQDQILLAKPDPKPICSRPELDQLAIKYPNEGIHLIQGSYYMSTAKVASIDEAKCRVEEAEVVPLITQEDWLVYNDSKSKSYQNGSGNMCYYDFFVNSSKGTLATPETCQAGQLQHWQRLPSPSDSLWRTKVQLQLLDEC